MTPSSSSGRLEWRNVHTSTHGMSYKHDLEPKRVSIYRSYAVGGKKLTLHSTDCKCWNFLAQTLLSHSDSKLGTYTHNICSKSHRMDWIGGAQTAASAAYVRQSTVESCGRFGQSDAVCILHLEFVHPLEISHLVCPLCEDSAMSVLWWKTGSNIYFRNTTEKDTLWPHSERFTRSRKAVVLNNKALWWLKHLVQWQRSVLREFCCIGKINKSILNFLYQLNRTKIIWKKQW